MLEEKNLLEEECLNELEYISEEIGEEYKDWEAKDVIFITAPTGSGKSYFMLHKFLRQVIEKDGRMLYLVNRRILKEQLEKELEEIETEICEEYGELGFSETFIDNYITISTYQSIENKLQEKEYAKEILFIQKFTCVVYDECHYFYTDSNFNTSTELSYLFLTRIFKDGLQIYISATPDKIKENVEWHLRKRKKILEYSKPSVFDCAEEIQEYKVKDNYNYVQTMIFEKIEDLTEIIKENVNEKGEKWLIFVDNIDRGKEFQSSLLNEKNDKKEDRKDEYKISQEDVIFLDTHYRKKEDTKESAKEIVDKKFSSKKVVISTAVLDNGVSFHDLGLRNIVILADTEETFVQMLGRKRKDGNKVKLYICKQSVEHFKRRKKHVEEVLRCYKQYRNNLTFVSKLLYPEMDLYEESLIMRSSVEFENKKNAYFKRYVDYMRCLGNQQNVLKGLLENSVASGYIKELCYSWNGILFFNQFSISRCRKLKLFYNSMIEKLENDEFAFVKQQAEWLGMPEEEWEQIIYDSQKDIKEKNCEILEQAIEKVLNKSMNKKDNIRWKLEMKDVLIYFLGKDSGFKNNEAVQIKKNDRVLSDEKFNRCVEQAGLPYKMDVIRKSEKNDTLYVISKVHKNQEESEKQKDETEITQS